MKSPKSLSRFVLPTAVQSNISHATNISRSEACLALSSSRSEKALSSSFHGTLESSYSGRQFAVNSTHQYNVSRSFSVTAQAFEFAVLDTPPSIGSSATMSEDDVQLFEYMSAANPKMPKIPFGALPAELHESGPTRLIPFDISPHLQTSFPATTPNLLAQYVRINKYDSIEVNSVSTSQFYYVIRGYGRTETELGTVTWSAGDVFVIPGGVKTTHFASSDSALYFVDDSPLLSYLGVEPKTTKFNPTHYTGDALNRELQKIRMQPGATKRNRCGILLGNAANPLTKTITHTLWSLLNIIPHSLVQKPHRHNSVALDLVVLAKPGVYTLIAKEVDADGNLVNPVRQDWHSGEVFITPPGWWHSHHNESDEEAIVLPVQDAGLHTYLRTLDIQFT